jgi:hypothetical protein
MRRLYEWKDDNGKKINLTTSAITSPTPSSNKNYLDHTDRYKKLLAQIDSDKIVKYTINLLDDRILAITLNNGVGVKIIFKPYVPCYVVQVDGYDTKCDDYKEVLKTLIIEGIIGDTDLCESVSSVVEEFKEYETLWEAKRLAPTFYVLIGMHIVKKMHHTPSSIFNNFMGDQLDIFDVSSDLTSIKNNFKKEVISEWSMLPKDQPKNKFILVEIHADQVTGTLNKKALKLIKDQQPNEDGIYDFLADGSEIRCFLTNQYSKTKNNFSKILYNLDIEELDNSLTTDGLDRNKMTQKYINDYIIKFIDSKMSEQDLKGAPIDFM